MAIEVKKDEGVIADINVVPFVEVVLVLLIIFMVTSTAIVKAAIKVDLPQAAAAGESVETTINVVYTKDKQLYLDGNQMSISAAQERIEQLTAKDASLQAVISADMELPYGEVVAIVDMVKIAGVNTFALNIERKSGAANGE